MSVEVAVAPEEVQLVEGCSCFANSVVDVCVGGAVLSDVDSKISGLCLDFDCEGLEVFFALLWSGGRSECVARTCLKKQCDRRPLG